SLNQLLASLARLNYSVHKSTFGGNIGVGKTIAKFFDLLLTGFRTIGSFIEVATVDDIDSTFWAHDGDFRSRPRIIHVCANMLGGHDAVCAYVSLASDDSNLGHRGFSEGKQ